MKSTTAIAAGTLDLKPAGTLVYVVHDWSGDVIYVGMTDNLTARMASHQQRSEWWPQAQHLEWELWPTRREAGRRESALIQAHRPAWNVSMNADPRPRVPDSAQWRRLGLAVRERRQEQQRTQTSMAAELGIQVQTIRRLEQGEASTLAEEHYERLEVALDWARGSVQAVFAGGEPRPLTAAERADRAARAARAFHEAQDA